MDKLTQDAAAAKAAGMSYGRWQALYGTPAKKIEVKGFPADWKQCPWCGVHFKAMPKNKKYCDIQCQKQAQRAREKGVVV